MKIELKPFTKDCVLNRELVIRMLKYEDDFVNLPEQQQRYRENPYGLEAIYDTHRFVLRHFGFDTTDKSVENYRTIFITYFESPENYDKEVIESVHYMRANKCVFYTSPIISKGDNIKNILTNLYVLVARCLGKKDTISSYVDSSKYLTMIAAFSMS